MPGNEQGTAGGFPPIAEAAAGVVIGMFTFKTKRAIAALAVGFTAVPAVALAATDAVPGDPFRLGQDNRIVNASTTLTGNGQLTSGVLQVRKESGPGIGAVLKVVNEGTGIARGIDINVAPGKSPISVNPDAGKASGLNADRLDGRDEEDFLPARLYGNGTTTLVSGTEGGGKIVTLHALNANLTCDDGDIALSAGGTAIDPNDHLIGMTPFRDSYHIQFQDNGAPGKFKANIICMDNARPFR